MSCAQPQAEAVSLERKKARFFLKINIRPVVVEIFPISLGFNLDKIGPVFDEVFLLFIFEVVFRGRSSLF